jgi:putative tryptophan/tyrosine transport system substrate-binding protein
MRRRDLMAYPAGIAITWVSSARAQQRMPVIGYLDSGSPEPDRVAAFRRGLNETGYIEGRTLRSSIFGHKANTTDCRALWPIWLVVR